MNTASSRRGALRQATCAVVETLEARQLLTSVKVNFQTTGTTTPSGYVADTGATYASRGNGYTYGWSADNTANMVLDNPIGMIDTKYKTHAKMQPGGVNRNWEISVPNGQYQVKVVAGDYNNVASVHNVSVEGTQSAAGTPTNYNFWFERTVVVNVTDGKLTLSNGSGASDQRLAFVEIDDVSSLSAPTGTITNVKARVAAAGTVDLLWDDNVTGEAAFDIYKKESNGTYTLLATTGGGNEYFNFAAKGFHTLTGLAAGTYTFMVKAVNAAGSISSADTAALTLPSTVSPGAYGGVARDVTSRIEAEDFNIGGPGHGYTDNSTGNFANLYRVTDVDIGSAANGAYFVGWNSANEWTAYTVNVPTSGTYDLVFSKSRISDGGTFKVLMDGSEVVSGVQIYDTGSTFSFTESTVSGIHLDAGTNVLMKVQIQTVPSGSGEAGNIDWFQFNLVSPDSIAAPTSLATSNVQANSVTLTWTDNASNESNYRVQRKTGAGAWTTIAASLAANATGYTDTTVAASTAYSYRVVAYAGSTDSPASNTVTVTTSAAATETDTFYPAADTYVRAGTYQNDSYGSVTELVGKLTGDSNNRQIFMRFDISDLGEVEEATLRLYGRRNTVGQGSDPSTLPFVVKPVSNTTWAESITFNTKPTVESSTLGTINLTSATDSWHEVDITSYVRDQLALGKTAVSFAILGTVSGTNAGFYLTSKEGGANKPQLVITHASANQPPAAPSSLASGLVMPTGATAASVPLTWTDNASDETGFKLERRLAGGTWALLDTLAANATSYTDTTAIADKTYEYRLAATNANGDSAFITLTGVATPPAAASALTVTGANAASVALSWTDNATTETGYRVEYRVTGTSSYTTISPDLAANATSYTVTGLTEGTQYDFRVRAINTANDGWPAGPVQSWTRLNTPTGVTATVASSTSISVTWTDTSARETGYEIDYSTSSTFASGSTATAAANATSKLITGLTAGTTYYVRVRAVNADVASAYSTSASTASLGALSISRSPSGNPNEGATITLTPAYASGTAVSGTTYAWTVLKNGNAFTTGSGATFDFTPDDNGSYTASVVATTPSGQTDSGSLASAITVGNVAPTATITGAPSGGNEGTAITVGSTVSDPGSADTLTYSWSVYRGGQLFTLPGSAVTNGTGFTFTPTDNGSYVIRLTVVDDDGGSTTVNSSAIAIANIAPTATISGAPIGDIDEGTAVNLTVNPSDAGSEDTFTYAWSVIKNGNAFTLPGGTTVNAANFSFTPTDAGWYMIQVEVRDNSNVSSQTFIEIEVIADGTASPSTPVITFPDTTSEPQIGETFSIAPSIIWMGDTSTLTNRWWVTRDNIPFDSGAGTDISFTPYVPGDYEIGFSSQPANASQPIIKTKQYTVLGKPSQFALVADATVVAGKDYKLSLLVRSKEAVNIDEISINWGDNPPILNVPPESYSGTDTEFTHVFRGGDRSYGYVITVTVTVGTVSYVLLQHIDVIPEAPLSVSVDRTSPGVAKIEWAKTLGATNYRIELSKDGEAFESTALVADSGSERQSFTIENLNPSIRYFARVCGLNPKGSALLYGSVWIEAKDPQEFTPIIHQSSHTSSTVTLTINNRFPSTFYCNWEIEIQGPDDSNFRSLGYLDNADIPIPQVISYLTADTVYAIRVRAISDEGWSCFSNSIVAKTKALPANEDNQPPIPSNVREYHSDTGHDAWSTAITWDYPQRDKVDFWEVWVWHDSAGTQPIYIATVFDIEQVWLIEEIYYNDDELKVVEAAEYKVAIRAIKNGVSSQFSDLMTIKSWREGAKTTFDLPVTMNVGQDKSLTVGWDNRNSGGPTSIELWERQANPYPGINLYQEVVKSWFVMDVSATSFTIPAYEMSGLESNTDYFLSVRHEFKQNLPYTNYNYRASEPLKLVFPDDLPSSPSPSAAILAPMNIAASSFRLESTIQLNWLDMAGNEKGFVIQRASEDTDFQTIGFLGPDAASFTDATTNPNTTYRYRVGAQSNNEIAWSDVVLAETFWPADTATDESVQIFTPADVLGLVATPDELNAAFNGRLESSDVTFGVKEKLALYLGLQAFSLDRSLAIWRKLLAQPYRTKNELENHPDSAFEPQIFDTSQRIAVVEKQIADGLDIRLSIKELYTRCHLDNVRVLKTTNLYSPDIDAIGFDQMSGDTGANRFANAIVGHPVPSTGDEVLAIATSATFIRIIRVLGASSIAEATATADAGYILVGQAGAIPVQTTEYGCTISTIKFVLEERGIVLSTEDILLRLKLINPEVDVTRIGLSVDDVVSLLSAFSRTGRWHSLPINPGTLMENMKNADGSFLISIRNPNGGAHSMVGSLTSDGLIYVRDPKSGLGATRTVSELASQGFWLYYIPKAK